jgi:cytochrome bd-type quinol oxidase subunit 1
VLSIGWKKMLMKNWWLKWIAITTPLGFLAVEAGWTVTEVGRQPWVMYGNHENKRCRFAHARIAIFFLCHHRSIPAFINYSFLADAKADQVAASFLSQR